MFRHFINPKYTPVSFSRVAKCNYGTSTTAAAKSPHIRSLLFIPANSPKMLAKINSIALENSPDAFVPDLEDSVPYSKKKEARKMLAEFLKGCDENGKETLSMISQLDDPTAPVVPLTSKNRSLIIPRVNSELEHFEADLDAILCAKLYAVTVGKTECLEHVKYYDEVLSRLEREKGLPPNGIKLIPTVESARALINILEIATGRENGKVMFGSSDAEQNAGELAAVSPERVIGLAFGADDYASDMQFTRDTSPQLEGKVNSEVELDYARNVIAVASRAARIQCFDTPNVNFNHEKAHVREATAVKRMGFTGKFAIHPKQVDQLNQVFGVSREEYEEAVKVVEAYNEAVRTNSRGSLQIDGRMVDQPVLKQYQRVVDRYNQQNGPM